MTKPRPNFDDWMRACKLEPTNICDWMLAENFIAGRVAGKLQVGSEWKDATIVSLGPPIKVTIKGVAGAVLMAKEQFDQLWKFSDV